MNAPYHDHPERIEAAIRHLNRRIAEIRTEEGYTQAMLSEKLGVPLRALQHWEADQALSLRSLLRLAFTLNRPLEDFFQTPKDPSIKTGRPRKKPGKKHLSPISR